MTKIAYRTIKSNDKRAKVVAAPVLPRPSSGGMKRGLGYLACLRWQGLPVDVFSCHIYPEPRKGPSRVDDFLSQVETGLSDIGAPGKPLWVTEINYNLLAGNYPEWKIQPSMLAIDRVFRKHRISRAYWYAYGHGNPEIFGIPFTEASKGIETMKFLA